MAIYGDSPFFSFVYLGSLDRCGGWWDHAAERLASRCRTLTSDRYLSLASHVFKSCFPEQCSYIETGFFVVSFVLGLYSCCEVAFEVILLARSSTRFKRHIRLTFQQQFRRLFVLQILQRNPKLTIACLTLTQDYLCLPLDLTYFKATC